MRHFFSRFTAIFALIGPGIIAAAVGNDAGGITTYAVAGAHFGYQLLWVMVPVTFVLIIAQEMCARMGIVSGKGLSDLIRESYGVKTTFYILSGLLAANIATVISEFAGIAGSLEIFSVPRFVSVPIGAVLVWFIVTRGNYKSVEKIFIAGAVLYIAYVISGFLAHPDWAHALRSTVRPNIDFSRAYLITLLGIIGTTITPWMQFYLQASVVEKGLKIENYRIARLDVVLGSLAASIVAFFIMIASAATLFVHGITIENASDAARALAPFAGNFAEALFAFGLLNASLLGAMIVPIATAYYVCEGLGFESGVNKNFKDAPWFYGIFTALLVLGSIPALFPGTPLVKVMLIAQVINAVLLAPVLIFIVLLINKKWLMGVHTNRPWHNVVTWVTVAVLILLSAILVVGQINVRD